MEHAEDRFERNTKETVSFEDYRQQVQALAATVFADAGEAPNAIDDALIQRLYQEDWTVLSTAAHGVSEIRVRKFDRGPYDYQEKRVVEYLMALTPEIGAGMDPVGFLMASHAALVERGKRLRELTDKAGIDTSDII